MIMLPEMLVDAAEKAGIKVPPDPLNYYWENYVQFYALCKTQLNRAMQPGEHFENAKIIAGTPEEKLKTMTYEDFKTLGVL